MPIKIEKTTKWVSPVIAIFLWEILAILISDPSILPYPLETFKFWYKLAVEGYMGNTLFQHTTMSLIRVLLGFTMASIIAIPMGIIMGWIRYAESALGTIIETLRPIPPLAWIPLVLLWFGGTSILSQAIIIFIGAFFPILLNTISGVKSTPKILVEAAYTLGTNEKELVRKVVIPSSLPYVITGLRIGLGIGWMCLVAAEFMGVKNGLGLGAMMIFFHGAGIPEGIIVGMLMIGIIGLIMNEIVIFVEKRTLVWREEVGLRLGV
ncbi:MAG: ABC transporter permease [Candidatus Hydrothermarchaeota archaeon]